MSLIPEFRSAFALLDHPLLRTSFRGWPSTALRHPRAGFQGFEGFDRTPALDVREEVGQDGKEVYVVEAELPGAKKQDVNVEFSESGRTLTVSGKVERSYRRGADGAIRTIEPSPSTADAGTNAVDATASVSDAVTATPSENGNGKDDVTWHAWERSYGSFSRSIRFPEAVDSETARASYVDGVLKVEVPKRVAEGRKKIEIA